MARLKGIGVNFRFGPRGYPEPAEDVQLLSDSIETILKTLAGERVHRPTFGSNLRRVLFANMNRASVARARTEAFQAIQQWEKRVIVDEILVAGDDNVINMSVIWRPVRNPDEQSQTALRFEV